MERNLVPTACSPVSSGKSGRVLPDALDMWLHLKPCVARNILCGEKTEQSARFAGLRLCFPSSK